MNKLKFNQRILVKVSYGFLLGTIFFLMLVGSYMHLPLSTILRVTLIKDKLEAVVQAQNKIDQILYNRFSDIQSIAGEESFQKYLFELFSKENVPDENRVKKNLKRMQDLSLVSGPWESLSVINTNGIMVLSTIEDEMGKSIENEPINKIAFEAALKGEVYYSSYTFSDNTDQSSVVFSAPIRNMDDSKRPIVGVIIGNFSWMVIEQVLDDFINGNVTLINEAGKIIASNALFIKEEDRVNEAQMKAVMHKLGHTSSRSEIVFPQEGIFLKETLVSIAVQQGYLNYKGSGWCLVYSEPTSIIFAPLNKTIMRILLVIMLFIIMIASLCLLIVQRIIIYPLDHLFWTIQKISAGDLSQQVSIIAIDEIGQLGETFNQMASNLKESYLSLEEKVQQRTRIMNKTLQELQKSNDELKQMQAQLFQSEKLAAIGQLAAGVAHEINNPVGFISNNIEILKEYILVYKKIAETTDNLKKSIEDQDMEKARGIIAGLKKLEEEYNIEFIKNDVDGLIDKSRMGIERIKKIVLDLRIFARQDSEDVWESIKIEEAIDSILSIVHSELKYKAEVVKEYTNTAFIKCNQQKMGQVFINLFINAAQAIKERGKITIRTYKEDQWVCIDVSDTGQGIPQENLKKIFDPFFTTKPVGKGTGLGLSVCHEIIAKHQGVITVRSKAGEGTTFTVKLPIV